MFSFDSDLKSWSLTLGKSLMSIPILTVVSVLLGSEFLRKNYECSFFQEKEDYLISDQRIGAFDNCLIIP